MGGTWGFPLSTMAEKVPVFHNYAFEGPFMYVAIFLFFATKGPGKFAVSTALGWDKDKSLVGLLKQYTRPRRRGCKTNYFYFVDENIFWGKKKKKKKKKKSFRGKKKKKKKKKKKS